MGTALPLDAASSGVGSVGWLVARAVAIEFLAIVGACLLTSFVYFQSVLSGLPPVHQYSWMALLIATLIVLPALAFKQYVAVQVQPRDRFMWSGFGSVVLGFSLFLSILFVFKIGPEYSRGTLFGQFVMVAIVVLIARSSTHARVRQAIESGAVAARRALLVGETGGSEEILNNLQRFGVRWTHVIRYPSIHGQMAPGVQLYSNNIRSFVERCRALKPDDIIFLADPTDMQRIAILVDALSELPITAHVIQRGVNDFWGAARIVDFNGTAALQVLQPPLSTVDLAVKRIFDVVAAGLGLLMLSPLLAIVALVIKVTSPGPILFRQNRHGYNNEVIPVLKFRTMTSTEDGETAATFTQAKTNDERVTSFGRILRKANIDELPQLWNVLRGQMSIVGPRPHPLALNAMYQERIAPFSRRHNVKPGLTGWAQVNGLRGETDGIEKMRERIEYDLHYIDNWSLMLDFKIILMTLFSKNAYRNAV